MELEAYGPIDRLYQSFTPEPPSVPEAVQAPPTSGIRIWHLAVVAVGLGLIGFAVWKIRKSKKKDSN